MLLTDLGRVDTKAVIDRIRRSCIVEARTNTAKQRLVDVVIVAAVDMAIVAPKKNWLSKALGSILSWKTRSSIR